MIRKLYNSQDRRRANLVYENAKYIPGRPIRESKRSTIQMGIVGVLGVGLTVVLVITDSGWELGSAFIGFCGLLGVGIFISYLNISITFETHGLTYKNFRRKKHDIPYTSITQYGLEKKFFGPVLIVYTDNKKFEFDPDWIGFDYLREQIKENVGTEKEQNKTYFKPHWLQ